MADEQIINIKVEVGGRSLPLTINESEREGIIAAQELIETKITLLKDKYKIQDQRDYLAMALLLIATDYLKNRNGQEVVEETRQQLNGLEQKLKDFLGES